MQRRVAGRDLGLMRPNIAPTQTVAAKDRNVSG
jgi:hypothetical protein